MGPHGANAQVYTQIRPYAAPLDRTLDMDLSVVVIPLHDEEENVLPLLREMAAALDGRFDYEVVCLDDGSGDGAASQLATAEKEFPRLRLIARERRATVATGDVT